MWLSIVNSAVLGLIAEVVVVSVAALGAKMTAHLIMTFYGH